MDRVQYRQYLSDRLKEAHITHAEVWVSLGFATVWGTTDQVLLRGHIAHLSDPKVEAQWLASGDSVTNVIFKRKGNLYPGAYYEKGRRLVAGEVFVGDTPYRIPQSYKGWKG